MTAPAPSYHPVAASLRQILDEVSAEFLERRAVIEAVLMTVLAKEHCFILGPPGTGKSALVRNIVERIDNATYFEAILSKTRPDAAVLGPYDLPLLKNTGTFHRKDNGFLTSVEYAFLDEAGKMSPTLGHDLLAALNERIKHEVNGQRSAHKIPLMSCFTASNELIVEESDDGAALWDRLLVRTIVDDIQESGNFAVLLQSAVAGPSTATRTTVEFKDLKQAIEIEVPQIDVPVGTLETMIKLRDELRSAQITPSGRRWKACVRLLQASAFFNGRSQVEDDDLHVLRYALWDGPEQIVPVERMTLSLSNPVAEKCLGLLDDAEQIAAGIRDRKGQSLEARAAYGTEANGKLKVLVSEIAALKQESLAAGRSTTKVDEVADRVAAVRRSVYVDCLDMDPSMIR